jgi:hypothetical protein
VGSDCNVESKSIEFFFVLNPPFGVFITDEEALGYGA